MIKKRLDYFQLIHYKLTNIGYKLISQGNGLNNISENKVYILPETLTTITITDNDYSDIEELWTLLGVDQDTVISAMRKKWEEDYPSESISDNDIMVMIDREDFLFMEVMKEVINNNIEVLQ